MKTSASTAPGPAPGTPVPRAAPAPTTPEPANGARFDFGAITIGPPPVRLQRELVVGGVEDPAEDEADQVAEMFARRRGTAAASAAAPPPASAASPPSLVQRKCGACRDDDEAVRASGPGAGFAAGAVPVDVASGIHEASSAGGRPLPAASRRELEPFFGFDFGQVRVHADERAARLARSVDAAAFTVGTDVFFAPGRFEPASGEGQRLLAHELTHVVQQSGTVAPGLVQRQVAKTSAASREPIVDNDVEPGPGAMRVADFMAALRGELSAVCNAELAAVGRSADGCPYLQSWLDYYGHRSASELMRAVRLYARPSADLDARGVLDAVKARVREAVRTWIATGRVTGIPESTGAMPPGASAPAAKAVQGKAMPGATGSLPEPAAVQARLGDGRPLESGLRGRMERAFGSSFGQVRVHDDSSAHDLSSDMAVRAFAVGNDVGFASGQYQPGTLGGDLLVAHELAHTLQQAGSTSRTASRGGGGAAERQADRAALATLLDEPGTAREHLTSGGGLQFQGCAAAPVAAGAAAVGGGLTLGEILTAIGIGGILGYTAAENANKVCGAELEWCLEHPRMPDWNKDFGPRKDCSACYRECIHALGLWPYYKCPH